MDDLNEAIRRVRDSDGHLAVVTNKATAMFHVGTPPCVLMTIGTTAKSKKLSGLIVLKGSPMLRRLNKAINALKLNGQFDELFKKWYEGPCHRESKTPSSATPGAAPGAAVIPVVVAYLLSLTAFY